MSANAVQLGPFSPDELQEIGAALCRLAEQPDAMIVEAWGEALGWKDEHPDDD